MAKADVELAIRARDEASKALKDVRRTVKDLNDEQKDLVAAAEKASKALSQQTRSLESVNKQLTKSQSTLAGLESELNAEANSAERLSQEFTGLAAAVDKATRELADASAPAREIATSFKAASDRIKLLREENRNLASSNIQIRESLKAAANEAKPFADAVKSAKEELRLAATAFNQSNNALKQSTGEISRAEAAYKKLEDRVTATTSRLDASRSKLAALNAELAKAGTKRNADGGFDTKVDEAKYNSLAKKVADATAAIAKNEATLGKVNTALATAAQRISNARANYGQVAKAADASSQALGAAQGKVAAAEQEYQKATSALDALNRQIAENTSKSRANSAEVNRLVTERAALSQKVAEAAARQNEANAALKVAEKNANQAAAALAKQTDKVAQLQARTSASKAEVAGLAKQESDLRSTVTKTTSELEQQRAALEKLGNGQKNVAAMFNLFEQNGRKSLSFMQRLRGQVLQLAAAYVSLYGTIGVVQRGLAQNQQETATTARLNVVFDGDAAKAAEELKLLRSEADRLGFVYLDLAEQYSKVAAAAKASNVTIEQTRTVFFSLTEASKALGLSNEQNERIFNAINQIFSKGKIQAEELRGQLGDALPGATAVLAKALGKTTAELEKMLEKGEITAQQIVGFAVEAQKQFGQGLAGQVGSVNSEINRTVNLLNEMQKSFNAGFFVGFGQALQALRNELGGNDGLNNLAASFGSALGKLTYVLVKTVDYVRQLAPLISVLVAAFAAEKIIAFAGAMIAAMTATGGLSMGITALLAELAALPAAFAAAGTSAEAAAVAFRTVAAAVNSIFLVFAAGAVGYQIGQFLNQFKPVQKFGVFMIDVFEKLRLAAIAAGKGIANAAALATRQISMGDFKKNADEIQAELKAETARLNETIAQMNKDIDSGFQTTAPKPGFDSKAYLEEQKQIALAQADINSKIEQERLAREKQAKEREKAARKAEAAADAEKRRQEEINRLLESTRDRIVDLGNARERYTESISNSLTAGAEATLDSRLKEVEQQFNEYRRDAEALISDIDKQIDRLQRAMKDPAATPQQRLTASTQVTQLEKEKSIIQGTEADRKRAEERAKLLAELEQKQQEIANKEAERQRMLDANQRLYNEGKISQYDLEVRNNEVINSTADGLQNAADEATRLADQLGKPELAAQLSAQGEAVRDGLVNHLITANDLFNTLTSNAESAAMTVVDGFAKAAVGLGSWSDAISNIGQAFRAFAAGVLRDIATMIIRMLILRAIQAAVGMPPIPSTPAPINMPDLSMPAGQFHSGGVVGAGGTRRLADPSWFASAQRFHTGGVIGLKRDEVPAILQTGEEVLSRNDPRNAMNGGAAQRAQDIKIINTIDSGSVVSQGLATREGETAIFNFIRANKAAFKQALS